MTELAMPDGVLTANFSNVLYYVLLAAFLFKVFAFVDAAIRREDAYRAADKNKKAFWLIILGLSVLVDFIFGMGSLGMLFLLGLIATIVYMVDVRPALKQVGGRRGGGNGTHMGPYGPW